ncbi:MAG: PEP-CTERM sorting domain-containing protein [Okeania sp. SIO3I5]|uniref:PEP-CTERM sorting domain-containing protein n=1 Tax=Okeania sp. SIO3I5 TaxID=2607805 RepID=UPI0013BBE89A|nr:PEP-CTERM sorting domain-containing protein [Okeania sp. SIO3I5]NEQ39244.1 PEP-CTERM sorting domain-containing protein [Okeania sp. SIO3I5]
MLRKNCSSLPFLAILTTLTLWVPNKALAISIKATATGSSNPTPIVGGDLQNGDFLILQNPVIPSLPTGDGADEVTEWLFDFSSDSNLALFSVSTPLDSAVLTLTLSSVNFGVTTDVTGIPGVKGINIPDIPGIPAQGTTGTISIELLDFGFTSADIINSFDPVTNIIPWFYQDDALISYAELELTVEQEIESTPEPTTTVGMLGLAAIALFGYKRQRRS